MDRGSCAERDPGQGSRLPNLLDREVPLLAVAGIYDCVRFFKIETREVVESIRVDRCALDLVRTTNDGRPTLAVPTLSPGIVFADLVMKKEIEGTGLYGHRDDINCVHDLPPETFGRQMMASCSSDKTVRVWDTSEKKELHCFDGHEGFVRSVCSVPDRKWIVSGAEDHAVRVWDLTRMRAVGAPLTHHCRQVDAVVFDNRRPQMLLTGSGDRTFKIVSLNGFRCVRSFKEHRWCHCLLFHPSREHVVFAGHDSGHLSEWDMRKEGAFVRESVRFHGVSVTRMVSLGAGMFASCSEDGSVKFWRDDLSEIHHGGEDADEGGTESGIEMECETYGLCCIVPLGDDDEHVEDDYDERLAYLLATLSRRFVCVCLKTETVGLPRSVL